MTRYSVQPRNRIFVRGFLSFSKHGWKYSQKLLDHSKQSATDALKTSLKQLVIWLVIKLLMKSQKPKKLTRKWFRDSCK